VAATASVRVIKQFTYRGALRNFSNRYAIGTAAPADGAHWDTLFDAITAAEKAIYLPLASGGAKIIEAIGYAAGSEVPVRTKTYALDGTGAFAGWAPVAGDSAGLIRYSTPDRSTKNHPVYCFNYYHAIGAANSVGGNDTLNAAQRTAMGTYASAWISGFSDGTTTFHRSRPTGDLVTGSLVETLITHRDLPH
jgi:hypothetical protein